MITEAETTLKNKIKKAQKEDQYVETVIVDDPMKRCFRFVQNSKDLLVLSISDVKILPQNIKKYFSMKREDRLREAAKEYDKIINNIEASPEHKMAAEILSSLYSWGLQ